MSNELHLPSALNGISGFSLGKEWKIQNRFINHTEVIW
jgi:hypothetical protein